MINKNSQQDEISRLLDSFDEENTLEQKIDNFSKKKEQKKSRVSKNKEMESNHIEKKEPEVSNLGDTKPVVMSSKQNVSETKTFDSNEINNNESNGTVVIDDKKIKSIINKENKIHLKRKVISKDDSVAETKVGGVIIEKKTKIEDTVKSSSNKRTIAVIVAATLGLILAGLIVFGVVKTISNFTNTEESSEVQQQYYEEILDWARGYNSYSDEEKAAITEFEKKFNKLTQEQKDSINQVLMEQTTQTFDELLAIAKSDKKENSKNNNTEIAQKKAELKESIDNLKRELSTAQTSLDDANKAMEKAQQDMDKAQQDMDAAYADMNEKYDGYISYLDYSALYDIATTEEEKTDAQNGMKQYQDDYDAYNNAQTKYDGAETSYNNAFNAYNVASEEATNAQLTIDEINMNLGPLQAEYDSLK